MKLRTRCIQLNVKVNVMNMLHLPRRDYYSHVKNWAHIRLSYAWTPTGHRGCGIRTVNERQYTHSSYKFTQNTSAWTIMQQPHSQLIELAYLITPFIFFSNIFSSNIIDQTIYRNPNLATWHDKLYLQQRPEANMDDYTSQGSNYH